MENINTQGQNRPLSQSDKEIFDILSEANQQYEKYLEINEPLASTNTMICGDIIEKERTYDHPLTLVITQER